MGIFEDIGHEFNVFFDHTLPDTVNDVGNFIGSLPRNIAHETGNVIREIGIPIKDITSGYVQDAGRTLGGVVQSTVPVFNSVGNTLTNTIGNLQLPLAIGAGVIGIYILTK